jgi:hypothetical protein
MPLIGQGFDLSLHTNTGPFFGHQLDPFPVGQGSIVRRLAHPKAKIRRARQILSAKTDTEAVERALDLVIADERIRKILLSVKGTCDIEDVYGRVRR